ncbi:hypothetical protein GY45DRAFT_207761 [Cubamyces sp. BRFM 1775]|nr:hypothetical protein GY45DRAFT_207761 [Cubamyces sp. BRFM 1775]
MRARSTELELVPPLHVRACQAPPKFAVFLLFPASRVLVAWIPTCVHAYVWQVPGPPASPTCVDASPAHSFPADLPVLRTQSRPQEFTAATTSLTPLRSVPLASVDVHARASEGLRSRVSENGRMSRYGSSRGYHPPTVGQSFTADCQAASLSHLTGTYCGRSDVPQGVAADGPGPPCTPLCVCVSTQYRRTSDCQPAAATYTPAQLMHRVLRSRAVRQTMAVPDRIGATTANSTWRGRTSLFAVRHLGSAPPNVDAHWLP